MGTVPDPTLREARNLHPERPAKTGNGGGRIARRY